MIDRQDTEALTKTLSDWLQQKQPERESLQVTSVRKPSGAGFSNETWLVDVRWSGQQPANPQRYVIQAGPVGPALFPKYDLAHMFALQKALREHSDVPVARMLWLEQDPAWLGAEFYAMEYIAGDVPADEPPYHKSGFVAELSEDGRAALWYSGVEAMAALHRVAPDSLGLAIGAAADPIGQRLDNWEAFEAWATDGETAPLAAEALAWLRQHRPRRELPLSVTWGDAKLGNMIFRDLQCQAIVDWELSGIGYAEEDLAHWLFMDRQSAFRAGVTPLAGIPGEAETVARFEACLGRRVYDLRWWDVYSCYRLAVIVQRVFFQLRANGLLPTDAKLAEMNVILPLLAQTLDAL